jgi:UDP-N-acetylmuramyl pentapeptide synthase
MLHALLGANRAYMTPGNWNNRVGVPMTLFGLSDQEFDFAVIEAGISEPKEMELLAEMIAPDLVIVTQLGASHLEGLQTMEGIAFEKSRLINAAKKNAPLVLPAAVYAYPEFHEFADQACVVLEGDAPKPKPAPNKIVRYSHTEKGLSIFGIEFNLASSSAGMRSNAALAIVAAKLLGADLVHGCEALDRWRAQPFRGESFSVGEEFFYIDCYNANPASMGDAIMTFLRDAPEVLPRAYIMGVMNELGNSAEDYHFQIGKELVLRPQDKVWFIGPDELTAAYARGARDSGVNNMQISCTSQPEEIKSEITKFKGAYFLKGSRQFKLETLLAEPLNPTININGHA